MMSTKVDVRSLGWQCETCGTPVDVMQSTGTDDLNVRVFVRYEPCGHSVAQNVTR